MFQMLSRQREPVKDCCSCCLVVKLYPTLFQSQYLDNISIFDIHNKQVTQTSLWQEKPYLCLRPQDNDVGCVQERGEGRNNFSFLIVSCNVVKKQLMFKANNRCLSMITSNVNGLNVLIKVQCLIERKTKPIHMLPTGESLQMERGSRCK